MTDKVCKWVWGGKRCSEMASVRKNGDFCERHDGLAETRGLKGPKPAETRNGERGPADLVRSAAATLEQENLDSRVEELQAQLKVLYAKRAALTSLRAAIAALDSVVAPGEVPQQQTGMEAAHAG